MVLKFTAYNISKLEEETRLPFSALLQTGRVSDLAKIIKVGMNVIKEELVYNEIDSFIAEKSLNSLMLYVIEILERDHFLELGTLERAKLEAQKLSPSQNFGEGGSVQPSTLDSN